MAQNVLLDQSGQFQYRVQDDGTAAIVRCLSSAPELRIPALLDGREVTALLEESVANDETAAVHIPRTVSAIADTAFMAEHLRAVTVDAQNPWFRTVDGMLVDAREQAVVLCPPEDPMAVRRIPDGIRAVGNWAFSSCINLRQVILPDGLEDIGYEAFEHCRQLTDVYVPASVRHIGDCAFDDCPWVKLWLHRACLRSVYAFFRDFPGEVVEIIDGLPDSLRQKA